MNSLVLAMSRPLMIINILLFFALAFLLAHNHLSRNYVALRVIDHSGCKLNYYEVRLLEKSVMVDESQRTAMPNPGSIGDYDAFIRFQARTDESGKLEYILEANYLDCESIVSQPRTAEVGHVIYESVYKTGIKYLLRSSE